MLWNIEQFGIVATVAYLPVSINVIFSVDAHLEVSGTQLVFRMRL